MSSGSVRTFRSQSTLPTSSMTQTETPAGKFYTRYALGPAGLRGFSVSYDKSLAKGFDRIAPAIANSFVPFPKEVPPIADARPAISNEATPAMLDPPRTAGLVGSGIAVSSALVVTIGTRDPCEEPRVAGVPARVVRIDSATGLVSVRAACRSVRERERARLRRQVGSRGASGVVVLRGVGPSRRTYGDARPCLRDEACCAPAAERERRSCVRQDGRFHRPGRRHDRRTA